MDLEIRNKRFLSLDVFRGIAILGVVVVHALIFGVFSTIDTALNILPLPMLIILSPVVIFAPMAGLFVFISSMSNGMVVQKRLNQGYSIQTAIQPILITGLALLILHFIFPLLFNHSNTSMFHPDTMIDAMIPASITQGRLILPRFENLLLMDAMAMISMACFFFVIVSLILFRKNSKSTVEQKMFRLAVVGFVWIFAAPLIWGVFWKLLEFFYFQEGLLRLFAIPVSFFAAKIHPITTTAPFAIFGTWFALFLYTVPEYSVLKRRTHRMALLMAIFMLICVGFKAFVCFAKDNAVYDFLLKSGLIDWLALNTPAKDPFVDPRPSLISGDFKNAVFNFHVLPPELLFLGMAICFFFFPFFIKKLDYQTDERKAELAKKTAPIQRFGTVSLTVFFWESTIFSAVAKLFHTFVPAKGSEAPLFSFFYEAPFWIDPKIQFEGIDSFMHIWPLWFIYLFTVIGLWFFALFLWSRFSFKFSMEWFIVTLTKPFRKIRSTKLDVLKDKSIYTAHSERERE